MKFIRDFSTFHRNMLAGAAPPLVALVILCSFIFTLSACTTKPSAPHVRILTYSSLGSKGGFLSSVQDEFKAKTGCEVSIETTLGASQVLSYLEEPKARERIDVVMGIDELLFERARSYLYLSSSPASYAYTALMQSRVQPGFYPVDYGAMSFIYRKADLAGVKIPTELTDFLKPEFKKKFILQDPRASSPGLLFFIFSEGILKISDLKKQWLTLAPSWDSSYKMFLQKDAPMVWSYLSSLAYHATKNEGDQYGFIDFKEGLPLQVEGMALVNQVGNPLTQNACIQKWLDFVLSPQIQAVMVSKQWMMPAVKDVTLPTYFQNVPLVKRVASYHLSVPAVDSLIERFGKEVQGAAW
jgi:thiamine transport system substrate-binding protein